MGEQIEVNAFAFAVDGIRHSSKHQNDTLKGAFSSKAHA